MGRGIRTVQRYEQEVGLSIYRPGLGAAAVAIKAELDEWVIAPRTHIYWVAKRRALKSRTNK